MAAAPIPLFSERHVTPKTLVGPSPPAGARCALVPASSAAWRGRRRPATWIKGRMVSASCTSAKIVDGVRVPGAESDEKPIIVIDNYDSFTYNLCQYIGELGTKFEVHRNDELTVDEIRRMKPRGIVISPGPGVPKESGISLQTVLELGPTIPIFGVCMGLQCIGEAFGGKVVRSPYGVVHGKSALIYYKEELKNTLFSGLPKGCSFTLRASSPQKGKESFTIFSCWYRTSRPSRIYKPHSLGKLSSSSYAKAKVMYLAVVFNVK